LCRRKQEQTCEVRTWQEVVARHGSVHFTGALATAVRAKVLLQKYLVSGQVDELLSCRSSFEVLGRSAAERFSRPSFDPRVFSLCPRLVREHDVGTGIGDGPALRASGLVSVPVSTIDRVRDIRLPLTSAARSARVRGAA